MRALAFVAVVLVGCSKPYEGTSFKARPKVPTVFEKHETLAEMEARTGQTFGVDPDDVFPDVPSNHWAYEVLDRSPGIGKTPIVFPRTTQPTGMPPASGR